MDGARLSPVVLSGSSTARPVLLLLSLAFLLHAIGRRDPNIPTEVRPEIFTALRNILRLMRIGMHVGASGMRREPAIRKGADVSRAISRIAVSTHKA